MEVKLKQVFLYTDGACKGNPGPGGWGVVMKWGNHEKELSGFDAETTNNIMELTAALKALEQLKEPCLVNLVTDSNYLKNGITTWIHKWKINGWKTSGKKPVKNQKLWQNLDRLNNLHKITWEWVKGHSGHIENERCDELANDAIIHALEDESV